MCLSYLIRLINRWAPRGLILDTEAWAREWSKSHSVNRSQASAVFVVPLAAPFLRKAERFEAQPASPEDVILAIDRAKFNCQQAGPINLYVIAGGRVSGPDGMLIGPDGGLLSELNDNQGVPSKNPIFRRLRFAKHPLRLQGNCLSLVQPLSGNYFHWLTEGMAILARIQPFLAGIDHVIVPEVLLDYQRESLQLMGIPHERFIGLPSSGIIVCERLFAPTFRSGWLLGQDEVSWLRNYFLGAKPRQLGGTDGSRRRLYITRSDARNRRVLNEHEVTELLNSYGFQSLRCSDLTSEQQAHAFHDAEMIVALHGAALTNLMFCREGTQVLEVFPPRWSPLCYYGLSQLVGCHYSFLSAFPTGRDATEADQERWYVPATSQAQWSDVTVPIDRLKTYLDRVAVLQD
jgi:capsular polysaccharide biosynthesis protein